LGFSLSSTGSNTLQLSDSGGNRRVLNPAIQIKVRGIDRSTLVPDEKGRRLRQWRGVKVPGHVKEVLNFVKAL
jgi:hypothetical protein